MIRHGTALDKGCTQVQKAAGAPQVVIHLPVACLGTCNHVALLVWEALHSEPGNLYAACLIAALSSCRALSCRRSDESL